MGERQQEPEQEIIQHFSHEHPLRRIPNITEETSLYYVCYGCYRGFLPGDVGYVCNINCADYISLHEECAKMGREIRHPVHPSHPLTQKFKWYFKLARNARCSVCDFPWNQLGWLIYICSQGCELFIHLGCVGGLLPADDQVMNHPSHPQHQLKFINIMSCHFKCNACGTSENGCSYICKTCNYWIHESCATLPTPTLFHHHHHHLSLSFTLPLEYVIYNYACGICGQSLRLTNWVYHCEICRYVVHIKCATNAATSNSCDRCKSCICVQCVLLPARNKHRLENHMLPLTFNASVNHPDEFYCASCEVKMNPKSWMYHCQRCDQSFHPECIPATSCELRNFNFGKKLYHVSRHPQHPLRLQAIFKKRRCDLCHISAYNYLGYQCTSCNFVMCEGHKGDVKLIDS